MKPPDSHLTFSVADDAAGTIVLQLFLFGERILSTTFPLADIADCGTRDGLELVGVILLAALVGSSPPLQQYPRLLGLIPPRQLQHARMGAPATRPAHLRASIVTDPNRLLLQRCTCQSFADATVATLSLARLSLTGPGPAGQALLRALAALHPDALTPFPALLAE